MIPALLAQLDRLIVEHASAVVLREHLALLRTRLEELTKDHVQLQEAHTKTVAALAHAQAQLSAHHAAEQFVEARSVLFKRKPEGGYVEAAFCPACRLPLSSLAPGIPLACRDACGFISDVRPEELPALLASLR